MQVINVKVGINGLTILKNITFSINNNEKVGLVGPNGSGKSTLQNHLQDYYK